MNTNTKPLYAHRTMRRNSIDPTSHLLRVFPDYCRPVDVVDAQFLDASGRFAVGVLLRGASRPVMRLALNDAAVLDFVRKSLGVQSDGLFVVDEKGVKLIRKSGEKTTELLAPESVSKVIASLVTASESWAGRMTDEGDHAFDPRTPQPGTHFRSNLLIGDRCGMSNPLLTTPKALVDAWGRGSSRSHSDKQILATRWDVLPEENGFPANRQFYVLEGGKQIFYSAAPPQDCRMETRHAANHTVITYATSDGLRIERKIFMAPSEEGLPLGTEAQLIVLSNNGTGKRQLDVVLTGMLGYAHPGALTVDVIYTCVTVEPGLLCDDNAAAPVVVAPQYTAPWGVDDKPFNLSTAFDSDGHLVALSEFCLDYQKFIGNGSLEQPAGLVCMDNAYPKKGPSFFALKFALSVNPGESVECQSFCGLVSKHEGEPATMEVVAKRMQHLAGKVMTRSWGRQLLERVRAFHDAYRSAVQISSADSDVDRLFNTHLPFQIRYQTYVSRSFGLTQKGFRQIGFREIQDLLAGMNFEVAAGRKEHMAELIGVWAAHVYRFGYADHQFYWTGIEPGRYSDDALWLFQIVSRFIDLTGDSSILDREFQVAGEDSKRSLFDTLQAILRFSGKISIGRNGLPLLDHADWNDTLNLDGEGLHGPEKEKLYKQQLAEGRIKEGDALDTDLSESVMNGFLLEIARAAMVKFARQKKDKSVEQEWTQFGPILAERLQKAWKGDFFARCFINKDNAAGTTYIGAQGDNFSADPNLPGSYFLNSFSWSILSGAATEEQISVMMSTLEKALLTPFGLRVSSPARFALLMPHAGVAHYAWGDRENGGVFKHATMMATCAMMKAARTVKSSELAAKLSALAWQMLRVTAPFATLADPYRLGGNPRFCTQYTNPATCEHIGPLLSGTAPWMWLAYLAVMGIEFDGGRVSVDPILPPEWQQAKIELNVPAGRYRINISKPAGFVRSADGAPDISVNGTPASALLPPTSDVGEVDISFDPATVTI